MSTLAVFGDDEQLAAGASEAICDALAAAVAQTGRAHLALSGGGTPERTYELLAPAPVLAAVELWFVDERCVGPDDADSNYAMVARTVLTGGLIDAGRVHRMRGELGPRAGAADYARELSATFGERPAFDVAVLGIGPDGHTGSLFPDAPTLHQRGPVLAVEDSPKPPPARITLSLAVLRASGLDVLLATGGEKASALARALGEPTDACPASLLDRERLAVFADKAAAPDPDSRAA